MAREQQARVLRVDLSARTVTSEPIPDAWLERYVGGKGLGARYLYEELEAGTEPLSPANVLAFVVGPVSGLTPGEPRYAAITKSPLTGTFLDSYSGGEFAARLAGSLEDHLAVLVTGRADEPVVLSVDGGDATIESAAELRGADAAETCAAFPDAGVACIGPAGEHEVQYATIAADGGDHHAGRGGAGAVMGSKNLKAVVARGNPPTGLEALRERYERRFAESDEGRWQSASETLETIDVADAVGVLPTRGWQERRFDGADDLGIEAVRERSHGREREDDAVAGGFRVDTNEGESVPRGAAPIVLGAGLGIDDFDAVATLGAVCDKLAVDVISAGNAVAWAVRASQEGLLERDLSFGDEDAAQDVIREIATRETPLGDALADGIDAAAAAFGGEDLIPTVKGMDYSSYDPRGAETMALAYATSDRGACHRRARPVESEAVGRAWPDDRARVAAVAGEQNRRAVLWSLIADDFLEDALSEDLGAEWLAAVGYDVGRADLATAGERIWTLIRLFNVREGFSREDDALPDALLEPRADADDGSDGDASGDGLDPDRFDALLERYYRYRGWDSEGRPTRETIERLGLADVVDDATPIPEGDDPASGSETDPPAEVSDDD
ncbi:Aldehyde ferredoxin oxidoreductase [Haloterrigena turkmenica DSM 5511]|uniref:Aldehyde ferredoxin oxidoreductase n=1 Tax=Haloterrigena turkmenica (strain ATCC 51198 / DSM 5511 / JCM 9101 / NCIMB 13204 / VKM B-1734 / 4k) TaxID=543526 RepID=D2RV38_HALTV|nr:aldehyde ferredoxin oxidoreductase C-terminal domain-containing protein [Haloterrigena turkmenica]ADB61239.1 Aldehyde ferredoxin oxidoreductase [Haloterrigena turkmenica DSM 5511]